MCEFCRTSFSDLQILHVHLAIFIYIYLAQFFFVNFYFILVILINFVFSCPKDLYFDLPTSLVPVYLCSSMVINKVS